MLVLGGNDTPSTDQVKAVLTSVGIEADEAQLTKFMSTVEGKVSELIEYSNNPQSSVSTFQ